MDSIVGRIDLSVSHEIMRREGLGMTEGEGHSVPTAFVIKPINLMIESQPHRKAKLAYRTKG